MFGTKSFYRNTVHNPSIKKHVYRVPTYKALHFLLEVFVWNKFPQLNYKKCLEVLDVLLSTGCSNIEKNTLTLVNHTKS